MNQNLFIIGPVASGKNTLLDGLKKKYNLNILDTGKLYRYLAWCICKKTDINPNFDLLYKNDGQEVKRISQKIYQWNRTLESSLKELEIVDGKLFIGGQEVDEGELYSKEVNSIISLVAKSQLIRKRILHFINQDIIKRVGNYALTGHNLKEMDTTQFTTIFLDITDEKAAGRLYSRNPESYGNISDAYKEVVQRNSNDEMEKNRRLIPSLYNAIYVDTTTLSEQQVLDIVIKEIERIEETNKKFSELQENTSIDRKNFKWIFHPILQVIKAYLDRNLDKFLKEKDYISKTDLEYQVLTKLCSYRLEELFRGDIAILKSMNQDIQDRKDEQFGNLIQAMLDKKIFLNSALVDKEIQNQIKRLENLYNSNGTKQMMKEINSSRNKENISLEDIVYKRVNTITSRLIAQNCHYLHTPRNDEFISYGAFVEGQALPIAWVSYSKQDREYKKQLLHYLGIEPQNTLEMTRAWCSSSAPQNIMSSLFQHSIDAIKAEWKNLKKEGKVNKDLQAITTTINPNLGFKASSFLGCNFIPFALRPAKFTYCKQGNEVEYMTRRKIEGKNVQYFENQFNVLPLNEIILCMDKKKQDEISQGSIYTMDKKSYNKVLEGEKNGKNLNCDQEQR